MALVKHHKVVAALPSQLEANAIYYVRAGAGFDLYVTNGSGQIVAYPANQPALASPSSAGLMSSTDKGKLDSLPTDAGYVKVYSEEPALPPLYQLFMVVDTTPPVVTNFTVASGESPLAVTAFDASDNIGVTGWWIGETSAVPSLTDSGWRTSKPAVYQTSSLGNVTLYARVRDAAGNISPALSQTVTVTFNPYVDVGWPYDPAKHTGLFSVAAGSFSSKTALPFSPAAAVTIKSVSIPMRKQVEASYPGSGTVQLQIRSGAPDGTVLATATVPVFTSGTVATKTFSLPSNVTLNPGTNYFFVLSLINSSGGDAVYRVLADTSVQGAATWSQFNTNAWTSNSGQVSLRLEKA